MPSLEKTFSVFGAGGSAPSFAPHADAEHKKGLFVSILTIPLPFGIILSLHSKLTSMGRRKKNRTAASLQRKLDKITRDKKKLKRLKKAQAAA